MVLTNGHIPRGRANDQHAARLIRVRVTKVLELRIEQPDGLRQSELERRCCWVATQVAFAATINPRVCVHCEE